MSFSKETKELALFDLDHTLLDIDSDYTWGEYIVKRGLVDAIEYQKANQLFYDQYIDGTLDAIEYNEFVAKFLTTLPMAELHKIRADFIDSQILPSIRPQAVLEIEHHRKQGNDVVIISATNNFVVSSIAELFDVYESNVLSTPLEIKNNRYTGKLKDKPNFKEGKIYHLEKWINNRKKQDIYYTKSYAYSDSKNDVPLLEWADCAVCISPDEDLENIAKIRNWDIRDWKIY